MTLPKTSAWTWAPIAIAGIVAIGAVVVGAVTPAARPAGVLDASFSDDGLVTASGVYHVLDVAIQPNRGSERYLAAVQAASLNPTAAHGDWMVLAYTPGGAPDPTFGAAADGTVRLFESDPNSTVAYDLALDARHRVVVAGTSTVRTLPVYGHDGGRPGTRGSTGLTVVRLTPDGRLDPSFNGTGVATVWAGSPDGYDELGVSAVAVPASLGGGVLATGLCYYVESPARGGTPARVNRRTFLAKFRDDGTLDDAFGTNGVAYDPRSSSPVRGAALQRDGKIVVAHHLEVTAGGSAAIYDWVVSRFTSTGALDATFGSGGRVVRRGARVRMVAVNPTDDSIVALGDAGASCGDGLVARYLANGEPDPTFDGDGCASVPGWASGAGAVALQPDGRVVFCGHTLDGPRSRALVGRLQRNGAPDPSFGGAGCAPPLPDGWWSAVAEAADGIVVVGLPDPGSRGDVLLARYRK